jgi:hypothetical protein
MNREARLIISIHITMLRNKMAKDKALDKEYEMRRNEEASLLRGPWMMTVDKAENITELDSIIV